MRSWGASPDTHTHSHNVCCKQLCILTYPEVWNMSIVGYCLLELQQTQAVYFSNYNISNGYEPTNQLWTNE